jgi:NitT/TauT family transport system ATP-binding protein
MPTIFPKCSPSQMMGLLVLLKDHKGSEDVARLADDLDLEIDEILPSLDYAEVLQLVKVQDGRASFTDSGTKLLAGTIRERKTLLREQLKKTTLFRAVLRALDSSPEHRLTEEEMIRLMAFTTAPADDLVQNIINWGRYTEVFRYDAIEHQVIGIRRPSTPPMRPPSSPPSSGKPSSPATTGKPTAPPPKTETHVLAAA